MAHTIPVQYKGVQLLPADSYTAGLLGLRPHLLKFKFNRCTVTEAVRLELYSALLEEERVRRDGARSEHVARSARGGAAVTVLLRGPPAPVSDVQARTRTFSACRVSFGDSIDDHESRRSLSVFPPGIRDKGLPRPDLVFWLSPLPLLSPQSERFPASAQHRPYLSGP